MSKLNLTFDEYIRSPSGKGSSVNSDRDASRRHYEDKLKSLSSTKGQIKYTCYRGGNNKTYYIHFKIPSASSPLTDFFYDTVVELKCNDETTKDDIRKYNVKFFSNDPDFTFTYAHAYDSHGLLIPEFKKKVSFKALALKANTKNPDNTVGYVRNIYFAYLIMERDRLFEKSILNQKSISLVNMNVILKQVTSYDEKNREKKNLEEENKKKKSNDKKESEQLSKILKPRNLLSDGRSKIPFIGKITTSSKKTSGIKMSKSTKKIKKI